MLQKRAGVSQAPRSVRLMCSRLDIRTDALPNVRGHIHCPFSIGSCDATETADFQRLWELVAGQNASGLFCAQVAPRCSVRSRSKQIGEDRVFQNASERRIVNSQFLPILDVTELLEFIHEVTDAASG